MKIKTLILTTDKSKGLREAYKICPSGTNILIGRYESKVWNSENEVLVKGLSESIRGHKAHYVKLDSEYDLNEWKHRIMSILVPAVYLYENEDNDYKFENHVEII